MARVWGKEVGETTRHWSITLEKRFPGSAWGESGKRRGKYVVKKKKKGGKFASDGGQVN